MSVWSSWVFCPSSSHAIKTSSSSSCFLLLSAERAGGSVCNGKQRQAGARVLTGKALLLIYVCAVSARGARRAAADVRAVSPSFQPSEDWLMYKRCFALPVVFSCVSWQASVSLTSHTHPRDIIYWYETKQAKRPKHGKSEARWVTADGSRLTDSIFHGQG